VESTIVVEMDLYERELRCMMKTFVLILFLNFVFSCSESDKIETCTTTGTDSLKYGVVFAACGPTDAAVVRIILTEDEFSCEDDHSNVNHISSYLEIGDVEQIEVGMSITGHSSNSVVEPEPAYECEIGLINCVEVGVIILNIECDDGTLLGGTWRLEGSNRSGNFLVNKGGRERGLCG